MLIRQATALFSPVSIEIFPEDGSKLRASKNDSAWHISRAIKDLNPRHSLRSARRHPVLVQVLHRHPPANSIAERHASNLTKQKPRG